MYITDLGYFLHFLHIFMKINEFINMTHDKNDFHTYTVQSEIGKRDIKFKGSKLWNIANRH